MAAVSGWVEVPASIQSLRSATICVRVEDVSRVDGLARVVAEQILVDVSQSQIDQRMIPFDVPVDDADLVGELVVRVHLDLDSDGKVNVGDYVSTEHIPVPGGEPRAKLRVRVQRVS